MLILYFDTNVYIDIQDAGGVGSEQYKLLRTGLGRRLFRIFVTHVNLNELASRYSKDSDSTVEAVRLTWELCQHRPTRSWDDLLSREVRRLADRSVTISVYDSDKKPTGEAFMTMWRWLLNAGPNAERIAAEAEKAKRATSSLYLESAAKTEETANRNLEIRKRGNPSEGFTSMEDLWRSDESVRNIILPSIENMRTRLGLEVPAEVIWERHSECPAFTAWLVYDIGRTVSGRAFARKARRSDWYDLQHAAYSAYSRIFVTSDQDLAKCLKNFGWPKERLATFTEFVEDLGRELDEDAEPERKPSSDD